MNELRIFIVLSTYCAGLFGVLFSLGAWAADTDNKTLTGRQSALIESYAEKTGKSLSYKILKTDLNEDGIDEFIMRHGCEKDGGMCAYSLLAESGGEIMELLTIRARNIALGNAYTSGVRNVIAYNNATNDYMRRVYVWEPAASRYTVKE